MNRSLTSALCLLARAQVASRCLKRFQRGIRVLLGGIVLMFLASFSAAQIPGSLDTTFGLAGGKFLLPISSGIANDSANAIALQSDGKLVLAGVCSSGVNSDFCVARINSDATLDVSFDGPLGNGDGKFTLPIGNGVDTAHAIALQPDGKIVLAGACHNGTHTDFCVARLNSDGSFDTTFNGPPGNGNGKFLLPIGTGEGSANAVALQPDGKIVLAGRCINGATYDFCIARLNVDGTLDFNFDSGNSNGKVLLPVGSSEDVATTLLLQPDGTILVAGRCGSDFCVARLNSDGTLDATFDGPLGDGNGKFLLPIGSGIDAAGAVALQPDGKIVLAGSCINGENYDFCVARLNSDGTLDASFDGSLGDGNGKLLLPVGSTNDRLTALAVQPDGMIVLAGECYNGARFQACVARLSSDGIADATFDGPLGTGEGRFLFPIGAGNDSANALVLQPDGKIVLAGTCYDAAIDGFYFCAARLHGRSAAGNTYAVTASAGANGIIAPDGVLNAAAGTALTYTVTPNAAYQATVGGTCGGTLVGNTYTTNPIIAACTVMAAFAPVMAHIVTPSAGPNGSISPNTPQAINTNFTRVFTVTPDAGYTASVAGTCGGTLVGNTYTTNPIVAACTVMATFAPITSHIVTPSAGPNGSISPNTPQSINTNFTRVFTVTSDAGYTASVAGTCGGTLVGNTYTTNPIVAPCAVMATFAAIALPAVAVPVPTLSIEMLILLTLCVAGVCGHGLRKRGF